jgi:3-oxoacyl-[acyl-carrier protein] reductase
MDLGLQGKTALVTGASRGIGRAIALTLASEGMSVMMVARDDARLREVRDQIRDSSGRADYLAVDLRTSGSDERCLAATRRAFGEPHLLVNNAGDTKHGDFFTLTDEEWEAGFSLKFFSYMRLSRAAWPVLKAGQGAIVNIIGMNARAGNGLFTIGGAVNAALVNLTKSLADLGVADGVRVNAINPGAIHTDRLERRLSLRSARESVSIADAAQRILDETRVGRFGLPEEIGAAVAFLASKHAAYLQGAIIDIDGGLNRAV